MFPPAVTTIWWIGLVVTLVVFVPLAVYLLHRTLRSALSIERYTREALEAARGVAANTARATALQETLANAGRIAEVTGRVEEKLATAAKTLAARARR